MLAASDGGKVELFSEFLDQPTFSGPGYEQTFVTYLGEKYVSRPPNAIVVVGQFALDYLLRHRAELFADVPVVHIGVDQSFVRSLQPLPAGVVGVPVVYDYAGTIEQALLWHPQARRLVVVTGVSSVDHERNATTRAAIASLARPPAVEFLTGLPSDVLASRLAALGTGDVVFTPGYYRDGAGRAFAPREAAELIAAASGAPVYGPYSTFIGTGAVGGRMPTFVEMGRQGARTLNAVLAGTPLTKLDLPEVIPAQVQIDWRQARRWGIGADAIPADAIVHFKEPSFWGRYRDQALLMVAVLLIQAALIAALLVERRSRRRTAAALEESETRMSLATRAASISMWIWDVARDRIWTTPRAAQRAGLPQESAIQFEQVLQTVHPADREGFDRAVRQAVAKRVELDVEYRMLQPGGEVRWIAARGRAENGAGERVTGVALDITERKTAELQAQKDRAALTHMTRVSMMGQLSASIAHQLNQPLAAILGNAEAARKMLERPQLDLDELKDICDDIVTENNRAAEVIRRLGALYKRGEMKFEPLDLNELVYETLDLVHTEMMNRHVVAATDLADSLPAVDGGRVQLQQVLLNLILNAADAMSGIEVTQRRLVVRTELQGTNVRLCVVDRGTGIAPEDVRNVFDAFWSTKAGGIGVGLAICQSIIKAHRGTLTASNNADGGATFCASWPVRQQD
ncbi:sensor histidine kinase [Rivibacter subsaxonicus]|uniref:histidine kinase n=1 Tax=Rivibacter subsaxonicus TaxID=457575 RepID=A0A4Q7VG39_9BURK|nr:ATP-binding protein [Rivibacter subsaxonicus]RZT94971.1 PAS domain S-box-containing protein [Rivibacter subsaxonicus]